MIYTVGDLYAYNALFERKFKDGIIPYKIGKCILESGVSYPGGVVFETFKDAEIYLINHRLDVFMVYGLLCNMSNTYKVNGYHRLLENAELIEVKG